MKVSELKINEFEGQFDCQITFNKNLNILSGENGTGKTKILQIIKSGKNVSLFDKANFVPARIFAISPKRNSQKNEISKLFIEMRKNSRSFQNLSDDALKKHIKDETFDNYSSLGELFYYYFEKMDKQGGERTSYMDLVASEFNTEIGKILPNYKIVAKWNEKTGIPNITIKKFETEMPVTGLSCGENELFSLILNLYVLRDQFDICLIDEPETHLNWHLEKVLFSYLQTFSSNYDKQIIVATHSRIIIDSEFQSYSQFLFWDNNRLNISTDLPKKHRDKLIDDAIDSIGILRQTFTIFCEDNNHYIYFKELLNSLEISPYNIIKCGTSSNVKSFYKLISSKKDQLNNCVFVVDNDNQGEWKEGGTCFFQIDKYCIENYAFVIKEISQIFNKDEIEIRNKIVELIKENKFKLIKKVAALEFLIDLLSEEQIIQERLDLFDASVMYNNFINWLGESSQENFWNKVFEKCKNNFEMYQIFVFPPLLQHLSNLEYIRN